MTWRSIHWVSQRCYVRINSVEPGLVEGCWSAREHFVVYHSDDNITVSAWSLVCCCDKLPSAVLAAVCYLLVSPHDRPKCRCDHPDDPPGPRVEDSAHLAHCVGAAADKNTSNTSQEGAAEVRMTNRSPC